MKRRGKRNDGTGPSNGHPRFGSRATQTASKLGRAISLRRLEELLHKT